MDVRKEEMKKDGLDFSMIKYIANTHGHPDHYEGCAHFAGSTIPVAMHKEEIDFIKQSGPMFFEMMGMSVPEIDFTIVLEDGKWRVGDTELEIYHTPGHSPGSVCIYWPEKKALFCGDLVFQESVGRTDFPGGSGELMKDSIRKISDLDIELLLPGHMGIVKGRKEVMRNFDFIIKEYFPMI